MRQINFYTKITNIIKLNTDVKLTFNLKIKVRESAVLQAHKLYIRASMPFFYWFTIRNNFFFLFILCSKVFIFLSNIAYPDREKNRHR